MSTVDPVGLLDHMVVNVRYEMDAAQAQFSALGFEVTPRGHHSLGSINHLMVFAADYLELLGLPRAADGAPPGRPELAAAPAGINGLVFRTPDVDAAWDRLKALDMHGDPPREFSRPVDLGSEEAQARFRTVHVRPGVFGGGRVYFCQHLTPELIWREEWLQHGNASCSTAEFVVVARDAQDVARRYAELLEREAVAEAGGMTISLGPSRLRVEDPVAYAARFGELALDGEADPGYFGAIVIQSIDLGATRAALAAASAAGVHVREQAGTVQVRLDAVQTLLEFRAR